ncbi:MAG: TPM domain-containing protein, partial [Candidatus Margulisiibacteriota bacterium]
MSWLLVICGEVLAKELTFPTYTGFVNDFAGVIDQITEEKLEGLCKTLEKKTSAELAIVTVKSVAPLDPKTYAVKLFEKWRIGKKGKDNGILVLLAMEERRVEIEVGWGLEGVINDARAGEILDKYVIPFFKKGEFGEGLYNGAAAIAERIAEASNVGWEESPRLVAINRGFPGWVLLVGIAVVILLIFLFVFASGLASGVLGAIFGAFFGFALAGVIGAIIGAVVGFMLSYTRFPTARYGGDFWG